MEIILSKQCDALTGTLGRGYGYHIQRRTDLDGKTRFWGVRQSNGEIPPDGHLRFIFACAELAQSKLHIADIRVKREEIEKALYEARCFQAAQKVQENAKQKHKVLYHADDIINLKITFGL